MALPHRPQKPFPFAVSDVKRSFKPMTDNLEMRLRNMVAVALATLSAACASGSGGGGPYLSPGPLPPLGGDSQRDGRAVPAVPASAAARPQLGVGGAAPSTGSDLPDGLVAADGLARLPGALVAGVGPVHGVAVSISLTGTAPARDEKALISDILGGGPGDSGQTIARALEAASGGKFRLTFSALPALVAARDRNHGASPPICGVWRFPRCGRGLGSLISAAGTMTVRTACR